MAISAFWFAMWPSTMNRLKLLYMIMLLVSALMKLGNLVDGAQEHNKLEYGADVSWPMQHFQVSTNYPWLPHNVDPSLETPSEYRDMPLQPLGNRQKIYDDFLQSCADHFKEKGSRCYESEIARIEMGLRQPQSMQVSRLLLAVKGEKMEVIRSQG